MRAYLFPGVMGLLIGLLLHWTGFSRREGTRLALALRRSYALRSGLTAVGWAMVLTALLCWLAVIDVDAIEVLPLSLGALLGGAILGVSAGLCGFTPMSAFAGLGGGNALEALSVLVGCCAGTLLLPSLDGLFTPLRAASPYSAATLFRVTLDEPWVLSGSFLGQACAGLLPVVIALCIPSPRPVILTEAEVATRAGEIPVPEDAPESVEAAVPGDDPIPEVEEAAPEEESILKEEGVPEEEGVPKEEGVPEEEGVPKEESVPKGPADPESAADDTFVALLEGEEPLVVDTELPDDELADEGDSDLKPEAEESAE